MKLVNLTTVTLHQCAVVQVLFTSLCILCSIQKTLKHFNG